MLAFKVIEYPTPVNRFTIIAKMAAFAQLWQCKCSIPRRFTSLAKTHAGTCNGNNAFHVGLFSNGKVTVIPAHRANPSGLVMIAHSIAPNQSTNCLGHRYTVSFCADSAKACRAQSRFDGRRVEKIVISAPDSRMWTISRHIHTCVWPGNSGMIYPNTMLPIHF
jgi:hypothetical protein